MMTQKEVNELLEQSNEPFFIVKIVECKEPFFVDDICINCGKRINDHKNTISV